MIVGISCFILYSAADGNMNPWAMKHLIRFGLGFVLMIAMALTDLRVWFSKSHLIYIFCLCLLIIVELKGMMGMGAKRWINFYVFTLQPSELMRIALLISLARYFHTLSIKEIYKPSYLIWPALLMAVPLLLVLKQPDLGTSIIILLSSLTIFFAAGVRLWKFITLGAVTLASMPILWMFLKPYQKRRIFTFLNPEADPTGAGYHIIQSKIALGSGGLWGKGYLKGSQSHLNFLPEKHTDFIFTIYCEEFGFMGGIFLIFLFLCLIFYGLNVAYDSRNHFSRLLALGLSSSLFFYMFVNIGMVTGILPVVGEPLPMMSYGGTSLLTTMMGFGLLFSTKLYRDVRIGKNRDFIHS